jgi:3-deoxy-D-manno-octulosonic-acid transferase
LPVSFNLDGDESIWVHAVSVGEVLTARALLPELREHYPRLRIFLSTTTITGQQIARNNLQFVDDVFYFPVDLGFAVNRTLRIVKPRLFVMMETEIWPNLLRACHRAGVKTVLVNGRISSRSYPRYRLVRPFLRRILAHVDRLCAQSEESARRLIDIGAERDRVVPDAVADRYAELLGARLEQVPGTGHAIAVEQPERVADLIVGHVAESSAA